MGHYEDNNGCQQPCQGKQVWDCAYQPDRLQEALKENEGNGKYNEVVVDAQFMLKNLPRSLLAVFYMSEDNRGTAVDVHGDFLRTFNLQPHAFPLLHFRTDKGFRPG